MKIKKDLYIQKFIISYLMYDGDTIKPKTIKFKVKTESLDSIQGLTLKEWFTSMLSDKCLLPSHFSEYTTMDEINSKFPKGILYVERLETSYICDLLFKILSNHIKIKEISYHEYN